MDAIEAALKDLKLQDVKNISAVAKLHRVDRSTLSRRFHGVTNPATVYHESRQLLNRQQEKDLIKYINELIEKGIPLTLIIVRNFTYNIARRRPRKN
jgi:hypothetical protein